MPKEERITTVLRDSIDVEGLRAYNKVYVLTEKGCVSCNRSFSEFIENELDAESLCIVNASGRIVDISYYQDNELQNVIFDYENFLVKNNIVETSSTIFLDKGVVDTVIELDVKQLGRQFEFFQDER